MIEIKVRMFGVFRNYERGQSPILLKFENLAPVNEIKASLAARLHELFADFGANGDQLIKDSAIADETQVLSKDAVLTHSCTLSILPPVCGG